MPLSRKPAGGPSPKIIVGSIMIIVGLVKLTGADKAVTTAAKTAAKGAL